MIRFSWLFLFLSKAKNSPNIVVMLLDDTGIGDISWYKQPCQESYQCPTQPTPNIDHFLDTGAAFTSFYSSHCVCSPSRAGLLTGRFPIRTGVYPKVFNPASIHGLPEQEITLAALLKEQRNYTTALVGKWHLGHRHQHHPVSHGFDSYFGIPWSQYASVSPDSDRPGCPLYSNYEIVEQPVDLTTITARYTEKAIDFLKEQYSRMSNPFFLFLAYHHSHYPQFHSFSFKDSKRGVYGDAMSEADYSIGKVMAAVAEDPDDNTLVFLSSDNGPALLQSENGGSAGRYRCGKGTTWEGGSRVLGGAWWPSKISPKIVDHIASNLDYFATITSLLGIEMPSDRVYDGSDLSPLIFNRNQRVENTPHAKMFFYGLSWRLHAIRVGDYKAHYFTMRWSHFPANDRLCSNVTGFIKQDPPLLYHLPSSPNEDSTVDPESEEYREIMSIIDAVREEHNCNNIKKNVHNLCGNQFGPDDMWEEDKEAEPRPPASGLPYRPEYSPQERRKLSVHSRIFCPTQDQMLFDETTCPCPEVWVDLR